MGWKFVATQRSGGRLHGGARIALAFVENAAIGTAAVARALAGRAQRFGGDGEGSMLVMAALVSTGVLGFAGLAVDVGRWQLARRDLQGIADQAAYSAAIAVQAGKSATTEAKAVAATRGVVHGVGGATVAVNVPPTSGSRAGQSGAVEVIVRRAQTAMLSGLLLPSAPVVSARAVALVGSSGACVMAPDSSASKAIKVSGGSIVNSGDCNVHADSASADAVDLSGGSSLTARNAYIVGNYQVSGGSSLSAIDALKTGVAPAADPYASRTMPSYSGCNKTDFTVSGTASLSPGVYCGGIKVFGTAILEAGIYVIDGGDFSIVSGGKVSGTGVTLILTSHTGADYGAVSIAGGGTVDIGAASSGPTAGMAFWLDGAAKGGNTDNFTAASSQSITGAVYGAKRSVVFAGSSTATSPCLQIVARTVEFSGNTTLRHDCAGVGLSEPISTTSKLVE
jgi:hypothetical protein